MRNKNIIFSFSILFLINTIIILFLEIIVRYYNIGNPSNKFLYNHIIPKRLPYYRFKNLKENENIGFLNNHGFHDFDRELKNDYYRYAFLGDSFVEGLHVPRDSLFTNHLNRKFELNNMNSEALNFGMSGTGTGYQYKIWDHYIRTKVDINHLVLCFFLGNDLENNSSYLGGPKENYSYFIDSKGSVILYGTERWLIRQWISRLNNYSALTNTIYQRLYLLKREILKYKLKSFRNQKTDNNYKLNPNLVQTLDHDAWSNVVKGTLNLIARWNVELNSEEIKFSIVIIHPVEYYEKKTQFYNNYKNDFLKRLEKLSKKNNINLAQIRLKDNYKKYFWSHYNYLGHTEVANQIYEKLIMKKDFSIHE